MKIHVYRDLEAQGKAAAALFAAQILKKPDSVLGFATGSTPLRTYAALADLYAQGALDFIVEICVVVDDAQIRVRAPRTQCAVVHLASEFDGFRARVVAEVIGKLRALGAGDEMEHHVVIGEHTLFGAAVKARDDLRELLV